MRKKPNSGYFNTQVSTYGIYDNPQKALGFIDGPASPKPTPFGTTPFELHYGSWLVRGNLAQDIIYIEEPDVYVIGYADDPMDNAWVYLSETPINVPSVVNDVRDGVNIDGMTKYLLIENSEVGLEPPIKICDCRLIPNTTLYHYINRTGTVYPSGNGKQNGFAGDSGILTFGWPLAEDPISSQLVRLSFDISEDYDLTRLYVSQNSNLQNMDYYDFESKKPALESMEIYAYRSIFGGSFDRGVYGSVVRPFGSPRQIDVMGNWALQMDGFMITDTDLTYRLRFNAQEDNSMPQDAYFARLISTGINTDSYAIGPDGLTNLNMIDSKLSDIGPGVLNAYENPFLRDSEYFEGVDFLDYSNNDHNLFTIPDLQLSYQPFYSFLRMRVYGSNVKAPNPTGLQCGYVTIWAQRTIGPPNFNSYRMRLTGDPSASVPECTDQFELTGLCHPSGISNPIGNAYYSRNMYSPLTLMKF